MAKTDTKERILKTGLRMWLHNPDSVSANGIADKLNMTHATVIYHFPYGVKDAVAEYALSLGEIRVVAQLITTSHKAVKHLSPTERMSYLKQFNHQV